ncbi:MAG: hypothetical protein RBT19_06630 [Tenuifilaceae bacterium]|jgi:hypothetical protein|nr:hypothetical protein [Tenuifilaceae bacterium]
MAKAKPTILVAFFLLTFCSVFGQNYIGLHKEEIRTKVGDDLPGFRFSKEVFNNNRSFVKFENTFEEQTLIFMLNTDGYCTSVSRMYNTWHFNRLKDELNARYGKQDKLKWIEEREGVNYEVELIKGDWFVTVVTRPCKTNSN